MNQIIKEKKQQNQQTPKNVSEEYKKGTEYKNGIGKRGIYEQSKINERMFVGDQWYGAKCGDTRPLVRRNITKRIGEYKISTLASAPISVNFSADGVPDNSFIKEEKEIIKNQLLKGTELNDKATEAEYSAIMSILTDYFKITAERLKFDEKKYTAVKNAYISGTAIAYTYWNSDIETGLYVDDKKETPIKGDIEFQILDVENVVFGDPNNSDVQSQPYIIISQRKQCVDVKREAKLNGIPDYIISQIKPDKNYYNENAGDRGEQEPSDSSRVTVYTKFYKEYSEDKKTFIIKAFRCTENVVIRYAWDIGIKLYPFSKFVWENRSSCAYGDSEITNMVPNQIAINRAYTAMMWQIMITGMPLTIVNGDVVPDKISNNPGEIIKVFGTNEDVAGAVKYIQPPAFASQIKNTVSELADETLRDMGATDAALGQIRPDNAQAIIQTREASLQPMQIYQNRFYDFIEDTARIWAQMWLNCYGNRKILIKDDKGSYYINFNAERYKSLIINARVDVGASLIYSTATTISTLDSLFGAGLIDKLQYFKRIPQGLIPDLSGLIEDAEAEITAAKEQAETSDEAILAQWAKENPEMYQKYLSLPPEKQQQFMANARAAMQNADISEEGM